MKIAIVHDWLDTFAGAEKTLAQMLECFPEADLFLVVDFMPEGQRAFLNGKIPKTTFIQKLPFARKHFRKYLFFMPHAIESFDFSDYALVLSSSHVVAKGIITGPEQVHICYCYTPIRYAWELGPEYFRSQTSIISKISAILTRYFLHRIRIWDVISANRVDHFISISDFIGNRIKKTYRRKSITIYPPVDTEWFTPSEAPRQRYYVTCSRFVPYKKIDLIAKTFSTSHPEKELIIIGSGPEMSKIKKSCSKNVRLIGSVTDNILRSHLQKCRAFVFASKEDFGIAPIEAQACGAPVIAFRAGGATETIRDQSSSMPSGLFFEYQTEESLSQAIDQFERFSDIFTTENCVKNANRFSQEKFREKLLEFVNEHASR